MKKNYQYTSLQPTPKGMKGFTMIEILVVISIVAILALVALPSQLSRLDKQKVGESLALVGQYRQEIVAYYFHKEIFPETNSDLNIPEPEKIIGNYVTGMEVADGAMHITFGNKSKSLEGQILSLMPVYVEGSFGSPVSWVCGYDEIPTGMTAAGENKTNIERSSLPLSCR